MRWGFSLVELAITLAVMAVVTLVALPRLRALGDWIAVDAAAREVTTALAVARYAAVMQTTTSRLVIAADTLRIDRWGGRGDTWEAVQRWPGPRERGVGVEVSNPVVTFDPIGMGWGVSNTKVVLRRGSQTETITVSRLGRVKRW